MRASSHREAPLISADPLADNTDLYAFVHPSTPDRVTVLANFIPLEAPYGGPNFFKFDDSVLYEIMVDNDGDAVEDVTFQFRFRTDVANPNTFLYNTGPIGSLDSSNWNIRQFYTVTRIDGPRRRGRGAVLGSDLPTPPVNIARTPVIQEQVTGTPGNNGWYRSDVQVSWSISNAPSILASSGCDTTVVSSVKAMMAG